MKIYLLAFVWTLVAFIGNGVFGVATTKKATDKTKVTTKAATQGHNTFTMPPHTDLKKQHTMLLKILRDSKIKQNRQWAEGQPCPSGWLHFNDSCYWGSTYPLSWFAAENECRLFGYDAHLASVHGADENLRVQAMAGCGAPWIGLTKMNPTQSSNPTVGWAWTDTSPNDFMAWRSGNPLGTDERNCAYQDKGSAVAGGSGWANGYCTEMRVFTCKADAKINAEPPGAGEGGQGGESGPTTTVQERRLLEAARTTKPTPRPKPKRSASQTPTGRKIVKGRDEEGGESAPPNSESPFPCRGGAGWLDGKNGFCYFYSLTRANWFQADAACRNQSSQMISIRTDLEQRLAMLGGCDRRVWLGAVRWKPEERWHWTDDLTYVGDSGFMQWAQNNTGANYVVAFIDATGNGGGRWFDTPSPHELMYYICKQPLSEVGGGGVEGGKGEPTTVTSGGEGSGEPEKGGEGAVTEGTGTGGNPESGNDSEGGKGPEKEGTPKPEGEGGTSKPEGEKGESATEEPGKGGEEAGTSEPGKSEGEAGKEATTAGPEKEGEKGGEGAVTEKGEESKPETPASNTENGEAAAGGAEGEKQPAARMAEQRKSETTAGHSVSGNPEKQVKPTSGVPGVPTTASPTGNSTNGEGGLVHRGQ